MINTASEEVILASIGCIALIFQKEPYLVIKAYETGFDFDIFINAVKDGDPEMALAGIDFWDKFIMIDSIIYKEDFKAKLFT